MSLTAEEIAMCRDALLEAGVPQRVVTEFVEIRDRISVVRCTQLVSELALRTVLDPDGYLKHIESTMFIELINKLVDERVVRTRQDRSPVLDAVEISIELPVLTPPGWKPPAKVTR